MVWCCSVNIIEGCGTDMEKQIPALFKPRARASEITITTRGTKFAFVKLSEYDLIGVCDVNFLPTNTKTKDTIRVKVSRV